jgi:hypothetical protein
MKYEIGRNAHQDFLALLFVLLLQHKPLAFILLRTPPMRDDDGIFGDEVSRFVHSMNVTEITTTPGSPWQNAYAERVIGSLRRECLDHVIVLNEAHLHRVLQEYLKYYHEDRPHQGLGRDAPDGRVEEPSVGAVISERRAGGLHHRHRRVA